VVAAAGRRGPLIPEASDGLVLVAAGVAAVDAGPAAGSAAGPAAPGANDWRWRGRCFFFFLLATVGLG
jgi:hypothetical protein